MQKIDKGTRATNFFIDYGILIVVWVVVVFLNDDVYNSTPLFYLFTFLYYFLLEAIFGQTIGKLVTKTYVVKKDGSKASILNLIIRSLCRLIPFDALTYLIGTERGLHDVWSFTKLSKSSHKNTATNIESAE
ncbi:MAG: RDD family protein [Gilvibacter sp.]